jgi:hypothetical protein
MLVPPAADRFRALLIPPVRAVRSAFRVGFGERRLELELPHRGDGCLPRAFAAQASHSGVGEGGERGLYDCVTDAFGEGELGVGHVCFRAQRVGCRPICLSVAEGWAGSR